ncbi:uncharacterized protein LOC111681226 isoform X2 [Lucilia cuprina]|uniref:uncharacterized protein LOC111681226 isoform X2 n=1 Tax=Lucilia cuprina TaxID=7375 RepID=UPI000C71C727|nr:uncharacterized protein LOC111681226 isoform X2 [Lucilia cuprina]
MKCLLLLGAVLVCQAAVVPQEDDQDIKVIDDKMSRMSPDFGIHDLIVIPIPPIPPFISKRSGDIEEVDEITNKDMSMNPMDMEITTEIDPLMSMETQRKKRSTPFISETVEWFTNLPNDQDVSTTEPCDLLCTKFELDPICASNGVCLHEFPNQCTLEVYNCKHKGGSVFEPTEHKDKCQMHWLTQCDESEM